MDEIKIFPSPTNAYRTNITYKLVSLTMIKYLYLCVQCVYCFYVYVTFMSFMLFE